MFFSVNRSHNLLEDDVVDAIIEAELLKIVSFNCAGKFDGILSQQEVKDAHIVLLQETYNKIVQPGPTWNVYCNPSQDSKIGGTTILVNENISLFGVKLRGKYPCQPSEEYKHLDFSGEDKYVIRFSETNDLFKYGAFQRLTLAIGSKTLEIWNVSALPLSLDRKDFAHDITELMNTSIKGNSHLICIVGSWDSVEAAEDRSTNRRHYYDRPLGSLWECFTENGIKDAFRRIPSDETLKENFTHVLASCYSRYDRVYANKVIRELIHEVQHRFFDEKGKRALVSFGIRLVNDSQMNMLKEKLSVVQLDDISGDQRQRLKSLMVPNFIYTVPVEEEHKKEQHNHTSRKEHRKSESNHLKTKPQGRLKSDSSSPKPRNGGKLKVKDKRGKLPKTRSPSSGKKSK